MISTAFAQTPSAAPGGDLMAFLPMILIFVVFYFLLIRPQQKKMRDHRAMIEAIKKGDQVVTAGGIIGKVAKVEAGDNTVMVEIAPNVQVKVARHTISDIINKPALATGNDNRPAQAAPAAGGGMLSKLFKK